MTMPRTGKIGLGVLLAAMLVAGVVLVVRGSTTVARTDITAYFDNSNGIFTGDDVKILGVPVGKIETIEPQAERVKITFWVNDKYRVPADARAVILSPTLVTARSIQLTPAYTSGPAMQSHSVIPQDRTAVPVEFDDLRQQLEKLTSMLQPTQPGGVSTLGAFVNTAADNLRGEGADLRATLIKISQVFSALGDHNDDIFTTVKQLSTLVSALQSSTDLMRSLNQSLASVSALLANTPDEVGHAVSDANAAAGDIQAFLANNRESLGTTSDKLTSLSNAVIESMDDIKQTLHVAPNAFSNFVAQYQPAQAALSGALAVNNFANPITFLCGAIQAASRLGAEQAAKLCVQYLAPIVKNRQFNFPPIGMNPLVGTMARPNELTYSEDWLRPGYVPPDVPPPTAPPAAPAESPPPAAPAESPPLPAEALAAPPDAAPTDPSAGLQGLMAPPSTTAPSGGGS
jgi:phospholipid/cholesterol/gamma-HCH transport system substrate-binding protein